MMLTKSFPRFKRWIPAVMKFFQYSNQHVHYGKPVYCYQRTIHSSAFSSKFKTVQMREISYGIFYPNKQSTEELISYGDELLHDLSARELDEEDISAIKNSLGGILYQLYNRNDLNLIQFFEKIKSYNALSEAGYNILMRYYADQKDIENVNSIFHTLQENEDIEIHSRSYVPLIIVSLRLGEFDQSSNYLKEMVSCMGPKFKENNFHDIINACTELRTADNHKLFYRFVNEVFQVFEEFGSNDLNKKLVDAICDWFEGDPENQWHIQRTSMGKKNGMCQYCKKRLKKSTILPDRLIKLKRNLFTLVKAAIIKKKNSRFNDIKIPRTNLKIKDDVSSKSKYLEFYDLLTSEPTVKKSGVSTNVSMHSESLDEGVFYTLGKLKKYLDKHAPFDIVIDALNMGYFNLGFNPVQVKTVVDVFVEQKKHILILCAGGMRKELLTMEEVPPSNQRLQKLMHYLNQHCSLFFVGSSFIDDYYILYTLIHHNFNIQLVSRDLFRDHLFHLDADNAADFQRWQKTNQYIMKAVTHDGLPVFNARMDFHVAMQQHDDGWHVPIGDRAWYCISRDS